MNELRNALEAYCELCFPATARTEPLDPIPANQRTPWRQSASLSPAHDESIEEWPWLDQVVLQISSIHQVCMTCHVFRPQPGANGIPLLTCHLHQGLIAHGEYLTCSSAVGRKTEVARGAGHRERPAVPGVKFQSGIWTMAREAYSLSIGPSTFFYGFLHSA
jgi:hypothetical protein